MPPAPAPLTVLKELPFHSLSHEGAGGFASIRSPETLPWAVLPWKRFPVELKEVVIPYRLALAVLPNTVFPVAPESSAIPYSLALAVLPRTRLPVEDLEHDPREGVVLGRVAGEDVIALG